MYSKLYPETQELICKYGLRNSQLLTCAPTGTLSTMLGISGGIEPIFANSYTRKTESLFDKDTYYKVYTPIVRQFMDITGIDDETLLPDYFITAPDVDPHERVLMQAAWQTYIDASISSTVNLPESATITDVENIYMDSWIYGLKGITVYRDNCQRQGILTHDDKADSQKSVTLQRGDIIDTSDSVIGKKRKLITGCGSLHCLAYFDPYDASLMEVYLSKGSSGGCQNYMVGLSRMISLSARSGVDITSIVDQLNSTGVCPSYAVRGATRHDTSKGSCCAMAVGNALLDMWEETKNEVLPDIDISPDKDDAQYDMHGVKCPECGAELIFEGGCNTCKSCGYSKCS